MSQLERIAEQVAHAQGRQALLAQTAEQANRAADSRAQELVTDVNNAHVDMLMQWGDNLNVPEIGGRIAERIQSIGSTATRALDLQPGEYDSLLWTPHAPVMLGWQAARDAAPMPSEVRAVRAWRLFNNRSSGSRLPAAVVLLYQEADESTPSGLHLAVANPGLPINKVPLSELFFENRIGQRAALLDHALTLDEELARYAKSPHNNPPGKLSKAHVEHITFMYYAARILDSHDLRIDPWVESSALQHLIHKRYDVLSSQLKINPYGYEQDFNDEPGRRPLGLPIYVETHGPLTDHQHLKNLRELHRALEHARLNGFIRMDGNNTRGPSIFVNWTARHAIPMPKDAVGSDRLGVYQTAEKLADIQATLALRHTTEKPRWRRSPRVEVTPGGVIGNTAQAVLLDMPESKRQAQETLEDMLDAYFALHIQTGKH